MSLALKVGPGAARIRGLRVEALLAMVVVEGVYRELDVPLCVITEGTGGEHSVQSLHYSGAAFDVRTRGMEPDEIEQAAEKIRGRLGTDYDVVIEGDHLHVEYQPRGA